MELKSRKGFNILDTYDEFKRSNSVGIRERDIEENTDFAVKRNVNRKLCSSICNNLTSFQILLSIGILLVGIGAGLALLIIGGGFDKQVVDIALEKQAVLITQSLHDAFKAYISAASLLHHYCTSTNFTRKMYRSFHEVNVGNGLQYQAIEFIPNVSRDERQGVENETLEYLLSEDPGTAANFTGLTGFNGQESIADRRIEQPFYFPVIFVEPLLGNEKVLGFDLYSHPDRRNAINEALTYRRATVSSGIYLIQETDPSAISVLLFHPGNPNSLLTNETTDLSIVVIRIPDLLRSVVRDDTDIYLFDSTHLKGTKPSFLGFGTRNNRDKALTDYSAVRKIADSDEYSSYETSLLFAQAKWTIIILEENQPLHTTTILWFSMIIFLSLLVFFGFIFSSRYHDQMASMKLEAQEKEASFKMRVETEKRCAERDLNDFIAHQIKNPLAAAMNASSFVDDSIATYSAELEKSDQSANISLFNTIRQDFSVVGLSLKFINELLGNTLDLHRAQRRQVDIPYDRVYILKDVFEPVVAICGIERNNESDITISCECSQDLCIIGNSGRLRQIVMNVVSNAKAFVAKGFIKLKAHSVGDNTIDIVIEDSGRGIAPENRHKLFQKKETESLENLVQYVSIGLCLSEKIVKTMNGEIWLDESYDSGIPAFPGSRLVVRFHTQVYSLSCDNERKDTDIPENLKRDEITLPENLRVLIVDDEAILRTLFKRIILRVCPGWEVNEAECGEDAVEILNNEHYDMIFMDQFMSSKDKHALGTEIVKIMRSQGVKSIIIGLSANDLDDEFHKAGANQFVLKPFPCERVDCEEFLRKIVNQNDSLANA